MDRMGPVFFVFHVLKGLLEGLAPISPFVFNNKTIY